ncbi:MAG TPA: MetQ/NlpA family ABC transporter substrate-binding protein [Glaciihabitans sp.]|jgi:D-methionine transport system substrate-binding protein|nr:MetQ/NlpA family ABC transporter substrate-binding protein [Glaciihabitans sp.]
MSSIPPTTPTVVQPPQRPKTGKIVAIIAAIVVVVVAGVLIFVNVTKQSNTADAADGAITSGLGSPDEPVRIGVVGASDPYWAELTDAAAADGVSIDLIDFAEYSQPNPALSEGELDLNQFQHIVYLAQYNTSASDTLVPVGSTAIYPLGLYSDKYDSVEDIPDGETIAIPNDPSNLSRSLLVLQSVGLVTLNGGGTIYSTLNDIDADNSRIQVTTLEPSLTATSLPDVAAAIINNDFVEPAGLSAEDAIAQDDPADETALPYVNVWAATEENKDNDVLLRVVDIYQNTQSVLDGVVEQSGDTAVILKTPVAQLEESLATVEADTLANE